MSHEPPEKNSGNELRAAEALARRLDRPMGLLGMVFLFVVLGQLLVTEPGWSRALAVAGWIFWAVFVAEFLLRAYIAGASHRGLTEVQLDELAARG